MFAIKSQFSTIIPQFFSICLFRTKKSKFYLKVNFYFQIKILGNLSLSLCVNLFLSLLNFSIGNRVIFLLFCFLNSISTLHTLFLLWYVKILRKIHYVILRSLHIYIREGKISNIFKKYQTFLGRLRHSAA